MLQKTCQKVLPLPPSLLLTTRSAELKLSALKKVKSLFISKEIVKAEISKIGPPYDMDFVEL